MSKGGGAWENCIQPGPFIWDLDLERPSGKYSMLLWQIFKNLLLKLIYPRLFFFLESLGVGFTGFYSYSQNVVLELTE